MMNLAQVPSATIRPAGAMRSPVRRELIRNAFGRRSFIKGIVVVAGSALFVGVESGIRKIRAFGDTAPTLNDCAEYKAAQTTMYGSTYANGMGRWWVVCNPFADEYGTGTGTIGWDQISNEYCNSDGYHRTDTVPQSSTLVYDYKRRASSCAGVNAWAWKVDLATSWQNKRSRRCSDGQRVTIRDGSEVSRINTACKQMLPGRDPAASTLPFGQFTPDGCDPDAATPSAC